MGLWRPSGAPGVSWAAALQWVPGHGTRCSEHGRLFSPPSCTKRNTCVFNSEAVRIASQNRWNCFANEVYVVECFEETWDAESQHGQGWKGPLWVTQPNPLPKQGHPEQAAQDLVQPGL